jgi:glycosyltransferase involved in cell wall biosynthesis
MREVQMVRNVGGGKEKVAVVYHFFPHYRSAVMRALLDSAECEYILVGDKYDPDGSIKEWEAPKDRFVFAPCIRLHGNLLWQRGLLRLAVRPDVHAIIFLGNANWLSTWLAALLARLTGKRVLFWTHGWTRRDNGIKAIVRRTFYRLAHGLLLYGNWARLIGLAEGFSSDKLYVIYNSLDYEAEKAARSRVKEQRLQQIRREYCPHPDVPLLIFTGRLTKNCRLDLLINAMARLKRDGMETCLLLVGDGPEKGMLAKLAQEVGVLLHFYGACYNENTLAELIMSANVTVSPGKVGLTAMHSLVYGTPVITHNDAYNQGPEFEAVIPETTGDFFKRDDVSDLARVITKWIALPWPNEATRQECYTIIERYYNPEFQRAIINRAVAGLPAEEPDTAWFQQSLRFSMDANIKNTH